MSVGSGPSSSGSPAPLYCNAPEGHLRTLAMTESAEASSGRIQGRTVTSKTAGRLRTHSAACRHRAPSKVTVTLRPGYAFALDRASAGESVSGSLTVASAEGVRAE